jgi:hypothetical protein
MVETQETIFPTQRLEPFSDKRQVNLRTDGMNIESYII